MSKKLTIYCCYHDESQIEKYGLNETDTFKPVYVKDDELNEFISEISMFKYILEHDKDSDYIGTCHYRRQIRPEQINMEELEKGKVYAYEKSIHHPSSVKRFLRNDCARAEWLYHDYVEFCDRLYGYDNKYDYVDAKCTLENYSYLRCAGVYPRKVVIDFAKHYLAFLDYVFKKYNVNKDKESVRKFLDEKYLKPNEGRYLRLFDKIKNYGEDGVAVPYGYRLPFSHLGEVVFSTVVRIYYDKDKVILLRCKKPEY